MAHPAFFWRGGVFVSDWDDVWLSTKKTHPGKTSPGGAP